MKENVFVTIKSKDENVPAEEYSAGIYNYKNGRHYCRLENGDRLILSENSLSFRRNGLDLLFSMLQPFSCLYPTDFGSLPLTFDNVLIHSEETDDMIKIALSYRLSQSDREVGIVALEITIKDAGEKTNEIQS